MWTSERIEKLHELWGQGTSTEQIAAALGGVSRNAVLGKAHRLGLSKGRSAGSIKKSTRLKKEPLGVLPPPSAVDDRLGYSYATTRAAKLLAGALETVWKKHRLSQRTIAAQLGYKQSVVLSHMALGRVPIPVERAEQIANLLALNVREFVMAVLEQRHPGVSKFFDKRGEADSSICERQNLIADLEGAGGQSLNQLSPEQITVLREVVADPLPERRWASVNEAPLLSALRQCRPDLSRNGSTPDARRALSAQLKKL